MDEWQFWDEVLLRPYGYYTSHAFRILSILYGLIDESTLERTHMLMRMRKHKTVRANISIWVTICVTTTKLTHSRSVGSYLPGTVFTFSCVCVNNHEWNVSETESHINFSSIVFRVILVNSLNGYWFVDSGLEDAKTVPLSASILRILNDDLFRWIRFWLRVKAHFPPNGCEWNGVSVVSPVAHTKSDVSEYFSNDEKVEREKERVLTWNVDSIRRVFIQLEIFIKFRS